MPQFRCRTLRFSCRREEHDDFDAFCNNFDTECRNFDAECAEEMCCRRRTRPQDGRRRVPTRGKNRLTMLGCWVKRTEKTPYDDPRAPPRGVHPGGRSRRPPGGTRGHGPHQGAKSAYNAPRGGGQGPFGHSPYAIGRGPWAIGIRQFGTCLLYTSPSPRD